MTSLLSHKIEMLCCSLLVDSSSIEVVKNNKQLIYTQVL